MVAWRTNYRRTDRLPDGPDESIVAGKDGCRDYPDNYLRRVDLRTGISEDGTRCGGGFLSRDDQDGGQSSVPAVYVYDDDYGFDRARGPGISRGSVSPHGRGVGHQGLWIPPGFDVCIALVCRADRA